VSGQPQAVVAYYLPHLDTSHDFRDVEPQGGPTVVYFFSRGDEFIQCEIRPGAPHMLALVKPGEPKAVEWHGTSESLEARRNEIREELARQGWRGPFGRDSRA
jgi:hypothetical protein